MNTKIFAVFFLVSSLSIAAPVARAQTPVPTTPAPASPGLASVPSPSVTLATLLARACPLSSGVALTVGAYKIPRLPDAGPLPETPTVAAVAGATGRLLKRFGGVTALAPPTMIVLNANPENPNPFDGMPPHEAMKLLAASLSPGQWSALTSERGMGAGDLTTDSQRGLFRALFPGDRLDVMKITQSLGNVHYDTLLDLSGEISTMRLRLTQNTEMMLQIGQGATSSGGRGYNSTMSYSNGSSGASYGGLMSSDRAPRYQLAGGYGGGKDTLYGVVVRAEMPNVPKRGQLDYNLPALQAAVPLAGLKTVGDLVARIGKIARLELYVDRRMETKTLTTLGPPPSVSAADLLRAVAFCLTGTFRKVGPAYVLTDDVLGYGTRRKILQEFQSYADSLRRKSLQDAGDKLVTTKASESVRDFEQGLVATPEQAAKNANPGLGYSWSEQRVIVHRANLNAAQQEAVARAEAEIARVKAEPPPLPNGDVVLTSRPELQAIFPSLDGPVEMPNAAQNLFEPSAKMQQQLMEAQRKQAQKTQADAPKPTPPLKRPPPPDWKTLMQATTRRAVLVAPKNAAEVKPLMASMKTLGFNQLWLAAPNGGAPADDVLTAALKEAKSAGIAVFPVLDLLCWPIDAPADARDLTVLGETSAQTQNRVYAAPLDSDTYIPSPPSTLWVSPFAPAVRETLRASVKELSARPGVAGFVWRSIQSPGYEPPRSGGMSFSASYNGVPLGYTEPARLAFLRVAHADPVDLSENGYSNARTDLPNLGSDYQVEQSLIAQWQTARSATLIGLLAALSAAIASPGKPAAARLPVFVQSAGQSWNGNWFGTWDSPNRPLPRFRQPWEDNQPGPTAAANLQAKAQSRLALTRLQTWGGLNVGELRWQMDQQMKGKGWDGFVLDLTPDPQGPGPPSKLSANPLAALAASVAGGTGKAGAGKAAAP